MSTAASVLMVAGITISRDIARLFKPSLSEKSGLVTARVAVVIIGVFGVTFALLMRGIFDMMLLSFALFWNKATNAGHHCRGVGEPGLWA